jgi:hypothetical protein
LMMSSSTRASTSSYKFITSGPLVRHSLVIDKCEESRLVPLLDVG